MLEFKNIQNIAIPDGNVVKITRKSDNAELWSRYNMKVASGGNGSVTCDGTTSSDGSYYKINNSSFRITATPNATYAFSKWNDGVTTNPRDVTGDLYNGVTYTATFAPSYKTGGYWRGGLFGNLDVTWDAANNRWYAHPSGQEATITIDTVNRQYVISYYFMWYGLYGTSGTADFSSNTIVSSAGVYSYTFTYHAS